MTPTPHLADPQQNAVANPLPDAVAIGLHVAIEMIDQRGECEALAFDIVPERAADFDQGLLGVNTPLAQAILGHKVGSMLPYRLGDVRSVRILSVGPPQAEALADARSRRQAALQKAMDAAARTNAEMFAASFSGKWGDYDPAGVAKWEEE